MQVILNLELVYNPALLGIAAGNLPLDLCKSPFTTSLKLHTIIIHCF